MYCIHTTQSSSRPSVCCSGRGSASTQSIECEAMPSRQVGWGGGSEQIYHLTCGKFVNGETEHLTHAESVLVHNPPHCLGSLAMEFTILNIQSFALQLDKGSVSTGSHKHDNISTWTSKNFVPYHKQVCGTSQRQNKEKRTNAQ